MNIRILLLLPLLLGVSVNGWTAPAKCDDGSTSTLPGCKSGEIGDAQPAFFVEMQAGAGDAESVQWVVTTSDPECIGTTTQPKLSVNFPALSCGKVTVDSDVLYLFAIAVKNTKKETSAMLFFTTECCAYPPPNETVFSTGRLPAQLVPDELMNGETDGDGPAFQIKPAFQIEVDEEHGLDVKLTKIHQPHKGDMSTDTISVGNIVYYTEIP